MSVFPYAASDEIGVEADEVRLWMTQRLTRTNRLAGAWWPRSTNLNDELPPVLAALALRLGSVRGILLNRAEWDGTPLLCSPLGASRLRIGWYGTQDEHTAIVIGDSGKRAELLLIPPATEPRHAAAALRLASTAGNVLSARDTLLAVTEEH